MEMAVSVTSVPKVKPVETVLVSAVTGTAPYGSIIARFATDKMIQDHAPGAGYGTGAVVSEDQQKTIGLTAGENVIFSLHGPEQQQCRSRIHSELSACGFLHREQRLRYSRR